MDKIALIGSTNPNYTSKLDKRIRDSGETHWGWTYKLSIDKEKKLRKQILDAGFFKIFTYHSKRKGGRGLVEKYYKVFDFDYTDYFTYPSKPELVVHGIEEEFKKNRGWYRIKEKPKPTIPIKKWTDFKKYDGKNNEFLPPVNRSGVQNKNIHWYCVIDEF